jgi:hypothetical protein
MAKNIENYLPIYIYVFIWDNYRIDLLALYSITFSTKISIYLYIYVLVLKIISCNFVSNIKEYNWRINFIFYIRILVYNIIFFKLKNNFINKRQNIGTNN